VTRALLLACCACGRIAFDPLGASDAASCTWGPFGSATVATELNSLSPDYATAVCADNLVIIFDSNRGVTGLFHLYQSTRSDVLSQFSMPTELTSLEIPSSSDSNPAVTPDGNTLYYTNNSSGADHINIATRTDVTQDFGIPIPVPGMLGTMTASSPSILPDELTLYFYQYAGPSALDDIYVATRASRSDGWDTIAPVAAVNTAVSEGVPSISADGLELFFSRQPTGPGSDDLYVSRRATTSDPFPAPVTIDELNTPTAAESDPTISYDGRTLWFARGPAGNADIYFAQRDCL
jgi:Tol biopolymer transport system component